MDDREKLVELIEKARAAMKKEQLSCDLARNFFFAEYLLNNGVTVQPTWISCEERLPNPHEDVLVYDKTAEAITCACLSFCGEWFDVPMKNEVSHWMPLPDAPKGDTE